MKHTFALVLKAAHGLKESRGSGIAQTVSCTKILLRRRVQIASIYMFGLLLVIILNLIYTFIPSQPTRMVK